MTDIGFAERLGNFVTSAGSSVWEAPGIFMDLSLSNIEDEEEMNFLRDSLAARTIQRFAGSSASIWLESGGSAAHGIQELASQAVQDTGSEVGGRFMGGLENIEAVTQRFIRRPLATILLAGSLADSETWDHRAWDRETWSRAREMAQVVTPGQALMTAAFTHDILDENEVAAFVNTDFFHYTTGTIDAVTRLWFDADILAAKGLRAARNRYLKPPIKNDAQIDEYMKGGRFDTVNNVVEESMVTDLPRPEPGHIRLFGVEGKTWTPNRAKAVERADPGERIHYVDIPREQAIHESGSVVARANEAAPHSEWVPSQWAWRFREFDRRPTAQTRQAEVERYNAVRDSIDQHGYDATKPIQLEIAKETQTALVIDGNRRLSASIELGIDDIPMEITIARRHIDEEAAAKAVDISPWSKVPAADPFPAAAKPSEAFEGLSDMGRQTIGGSEFFDLPQAVAGRSQPFAEKMPSRVDHIHGLGGPDAVGPDGVARHDPNIPNFIRHFLDTEGHGISELLKKVVRHGEMPNRRELLDMGMTDSEVRRFARFVKVWTEQSTETLRQLPDEFVVFRAGPVEEGVVSVSLRRDIARGHELPLAGRQENAYVVRREDVLADVGAFADPLDTGVFSDIADELIIAADKMRPATEDVLTKLRNVEGPSYQVARVTQQHRMLPDEDSVFRIADQLFPGDPLGLAKARVLADTPDKASREAVMRVMMGETAAAKTIREEVRKTANLQNLLEEAADIATYGRPTRLTDSGQALIDRKASVLTDLEEIVLNEQLVSTFGSTQRRMDALFDALNDPSRWNQLEGHIRDVQRLVGRMAVAERLIGAQHHELRVAIHKRAMGMPKDTSVYQAGPGRRPHRFVNLGYWSSRVRDKRVHPVVDLNDRNAPDQLDRMLRMAGVDAKTRGAQVKRMMDIPEEQAVDRATVWDQGIEMGMNKIVKDLGIDRETAEKILKAASSGRKRANRFVERSYAAGTRDLVPVHDPQVGSATMAMPLTASQRPQHVTAPDFGAIRKTLERAQRKGWLPDKAALVTDVSESILQGITWHWKANVLFRIAWPIRVTLLDESFRMMMKFGAAVHAQNLGRIMRNTTHSYMKELGLKDPTRAGRVGAAVGGALGFAGAGPGGAAVGALAGRRMLRNMSNIESMGFDAPIIAGVRVPAAFGEPGDAANIYYQKVSSGAQLDQFIRIEGPNVYRMKRDMMNNAQNWTTITPDKVELHMEAWQHVLNRQWRRDALVRKIMAGESDDAILRWFRTKEGREYLRNIPRVRKDNPDHWLTELRAYIDDTVPTPELRELLLERGIRKSELQKMFPTKDMRPDIHGASIEEALGKSEWMARLGNFIDSGMVRLGTMPTDNLARQPAFNYFYRLEMERILRTFDDPKKMTKAEMNRSAKHARERALAHSRDLLYDLAERREFHHMLRFVQPFLPAMQEVATTWTRLAMERPDYAMRAVKAWTGIRNWDDVIWEDPESGDQFITVPMPEWASGLTQHSPIFRDAFDEVGQIRLPKTGFNLILQSPLGFGPWIQAAVSEIVKDRPQLEESMSLVIPYGANEDVVDSFLAGYQRPIRGVIRNIRPRAEDTQQFASGWHRVLQSRLAKMRQGELPMIDFDDPAEVDAFLSDVTTTTRRLFMVRGFTSFVSPSPPIYDSPYWAYIEAYRELQRDDPETAFEQFIDQFGEEFIDVTIGVTQSADGIPPTLEALETRDEFKHIIERHPEAGSLIVGGDSGVMLSEFHRAAYDYQLNNPVRPGSDQMQRERMSPEQRMEQPDVRLGWMKYMRAMDWIDAERVSRGLPNLSVSEARDLAEMRRVIEARIAEEHPAWQRDREQMDRGRWRERMEWMHMVAQEEALLGRPEIAGLAEYLEGRQAIIEELERRSAAGGARTLHATDNMDLNNLWESWVHGLIQRNASFGPVYHRWLERDPMTSDTLPQE